MSKLIVLWGGKIIDSPVEPGQMETFKSSIKYTAKTMMHNGFLFSVFLTFHTLFKMSQPQVLGSASYFDLAMLLKVPPTIPKRGLSKISICVCVCLVMDW